MFKPAIKPPAAHVLHGLKPFQRATVDHVFHHMYERRPSSRRFLVADEVGLGKTLVARGLIARIIDKFWENPTHRIDIVYICSNASIARQNLNKLNFLQQSDYPIPDRITMLPQVLKDLESQRLNLVSFTPGTSFKLGTSEGRAHERALLYWLLPDSWRPTGSAAPVAALMGAVRSVERFQQHVDEFAYSGANESIRTAFEKELEKTPELKSEFVRICSLVGRRGELGDQERLARAVLVGKLRAILAEVCVLKLEPDLVILDEFQRFKDLLHGEDAASLLARRLFQYDEARVLLLSATPYKMYTLHEESGADDHYADFTKTVSFLQGGGAEGPVFTSALSAYRQAIFDWKPGDTHGVRAARQAVEDLLKQYMVRTERLASSEDRNGMLVEIPPEHLELTPQDVQQYVRLQQTARLIGYGDVMEFWKSAPYVLNFMEDYDLKKRFVDSASRGDLSRQLAEVLRDHRGCLIDWHDIERYVAIDPSNARLRSLLAATIGRGTAALLWLPPTLPYYQPASVFADPGPRDFTKQLVFSSWQVVPKVAASLLTYEAERALVAATGPASFANTPEARRRESRLLRFSRSKGRLTGMPLVALLYPSETLARIGDPLEIVSELRRRGVGEPALVDVLAVAQERISTHLDGLVEPVEQSTDESWYRAAPALLDAKNHGAVTRAWFGQAGLAAKWAGELEEVEEAEGPPSHEPGEQPDAWQDHVEELRKVLRGPVRLGARPPDFIETLALLAVAGPANVAFRALCRLGPSATANPVDLRNAAGQVAAAMRSMFNDPLFTSFLRSVSSTQGSSGTASGDRYWRVVLNYCAEGCLQAVLDEYVHVLGDSGARRGKKPTDFVKPILEALTLYTASVTVDDIAVDAERGRVAVTGPHQRKRLRTSYAARFGAQRGDDAGGAERNRKLQVAFNSPFWPFVLCSTSIGQEGLDFHYYCHSVVHWNLPSNPVDLEQREGRVHRYKGHAIRKNVARRFGFPLQDPGSSEDPWKLLFQSAARHVETRDGGLTPYWLYAVPGGARIERHIPALPLSLDRNKADALRRSLAVYRMAFGQARQEDVVAFLQQFPPDQLRTAADDLQIDLSPPAVQGSLLSDDVGESAAEQVASDMEPIWSRTADEPPDIHFGGIEELLDDFLSLAATGVKASSAPPPDTRAAIADLLDTFRQAQQANRAPGGTNGGPGHRGDALERIRSLLDAFALLLPRAPISIAGDDPRQRFDELIADFNAVRGRAHPHARPEVTRDA